MECRAELGYRRKVHRQMRSAKGSCGGKTHLGVAPRPQVVDDCMWVCAERRTRKSSVGAAPRPYSRKALLAQLGIRCANNTEPAPALKSENRGGLYALSSAQGSCRSKRCELVVRCAHRVRRSPSTLTRSAQPDGPLGGAGSKSARGPDISVPHSRAPQVLRKGINLDQAARTEWPHFEPFGACSMRHKQCEGRRMATNGRCRSKE